MPRSYDVDEPDLDPPDIDHLTPELRQQRNWAIAGVTFVGLGLGLMMQRALDQDLNAFWLSLGVGLLAGWARAPQFPLFAVGSIMTGYGLQDFIESLLEMRFESTLGAVFAAAGFLAVYVRYPQRARWALLPAAIMGLLAVADFAIGLLGLIPGAVTGMLLPLALIGGGALLLFRNRIPRTVVKGGVVAAVVVFVIAGLSGMDNWEGFGFASGTRDVEAEIPRLDGRKLVLETDGGDIDVRSASRDEPTLVKATVRGVFHGRLELEEAGEDELVVRLANGRGPVHRHATSYTAYVRPGTSIRAVTEDGEIRAELAGGAAELVADDGDVRVSLVRAVRDADADAPDFEVVIVVEEGDVEVDARRVDPAVRAETADGKIDVGAVGPGDPRPDGGSYQRRGDGPGVEIDVEEGDIRLRNLA